MATNATENDLGKLRTQITKMYVVPQSDVKKVNVLGLSFQYKSLALIIIAFSQFALATNASENDLRKILMQITKMYVVRSYNRKPK